MHIYVFENIFFLLNNFDSLLFYNKFINVKKIIVLWMILFCQCWRIVTVSAPSQPNNRRHYCSTQRHLLEVICALNWSYFHCASAWHCARMWTIDITNHLAPPISSPLCHTLNNYLLKCSIDSRYWKKWREWGMKKWNWSGSRIIWAAECNKWNSMMVYPRKGLWNEH